MKYLIASDIHGSSFYCQKLMDAIDYEKPDRILLLGDLLYHGPRNDLPKEYDPKKVIEMLNSKADKIYCVRGNCDSEVDQMVLHFPCLSDSLLLDVNGQFIYCTHGHIYNEKNLPKLHAGDILLHGHTHIPCKTEYENYIYLNPGSISIPKENSVHGYMMLKDNRFIWKDLSNFKEYMSYEKMYTN